MGEEPIRFPAAEFQRMILQPTHTHSNALQQLPNGVGQSHGGGDEEPYTIRCICHYDEDDGNTVLCERCDTWQHIDCYFPNSAVPDVHMCVDCQPRELDTAGAALRQQHRLENLDGPESRKARRVTQKAPKRPKAKELNHISTVGHTNGFAFADHKAGSPKDGGPPAKRPKTSHRSNHSLSINSNAHSIISSSRNRSDSNAFGAGSPPSRKIRQTRPHDYFSSRFFQIHRTNTEFTPANTNNHVDLEMATLLSHWLDEPKAFAEATNGCTHADVFQQAPSIEELEVPIRKGFHRVEPPPNADHGPIDCPYLAVEHEVLQGQLVGELRGLIGHQEEYKRDPANRWEELKHPQHFVFFHPHMPIYIDCRSEGTEFRNVRRSCNPNLFLKTFITDARDMRFCFTAERDIPAGSEITIGWDTRAVSGLLSNYRDKKCNEHEMDQLHNFAEGVLSHFGGCACDTQLNHACAMEHLDRRLFIFEPGSPEGNSKPVKQNGKKRRLTSKKSPGLAITNSRASSEAAITADPEDDDSQSNSRSSKNSRDASPNRPNSQDGHGPSAGEELSARDLKKLRQQERWFEKLAHGENQPSGKRKKRNSGNQSTLSPVATHPNKQPRRSGQQVDSATMTDPKSPGGDHDEHSRLSPKSRATSNSNSPAQVTKTALPNSPPMQASRPRPTYADAATQTAESCLRSATVAKRPVRKNFTPLATRLLKRSFQRKLAVAKQNSETVSSVTSPSDSMHVSPPEPPVPTGVEDVEMKDVDDIAAEVPLPNGDNTATTPIVPSTESRDQSDQVEIATKPAPILPTPKLDVLAPPRTSSKSPEKQDTPQSQPSRPTRELHVEMPPRPILTGTGSSSTNDSIPSPQGPVLIQSPSTVLPAPPVAQMLSVSPTPSIVAAANAQAPQQSPAKKKVSLSDYMKRHRKTPGVEKSQSQALEGAGTPAANTQQHGGSSPASASEAAKTSSPPPATAD